MNFFRLLFNPPPRGHRCNVLTPEQRIAQYEDKRKEVSEKYHTGRYVVGLQIRATWFARKGWMDRYLASLPEARVRAAARRARGSAPTLAAPRCAHGLHALPCPAVQSKTAALGSRSAPTSRRVTCKSQ